MKPTYDDIFLISALFPSSNSPDKLMFLLRLTHLPGFYRDASSPQLCLWL